MIVWCSFGNDKGFQQISGSQMVLSSGFCVLVLSSGFCVLAGDLGAQLALRDLSDVGGDLRLDAWLEGYNGGVSAGVIHTAEAMKKAKFPKDHGEMTGA